MIVASAEGAHVPRAGAWVDPLAPVARALVTHAHADHARPGCGEYVCAEPGRALLERRLPGAAIRGVPYGERFRLGDVTVSFHPAGHVLGSAQIRLETDETWVVTGDFKRAPDPTCAPFEVVRCDVLVTEATFALPIFRWDPPEVELARITDWWRTNAAAGRASVLLAYALGKSQRLLAGLPAERVFVHGAVEPLTQIYRDSGVELRPTLPATSEKRKSFAGELVIAPPGWESTPWIRRFGADAKIALVSGWMRIRGTRRRRGVDAGFALSDHADWPDLLRTIAETGARRVLVTHGSVDPLVRWLREHGTDAEPLRIGWSPEGLNPEPAE